MAAGGAGIGCAAIAKFMDVKTRAFRACRARYLCCTCTPSSDWREGDCASHFVSAVG